MSLLIELTEEESEALVQEAYDELDNLLDHTPLFMAQPGWAVAAALQKHAEEFLAQDECDEDCDCEDDDDVVVYAPVEARVHKE